MDRNGGSQIEKSRNFGSKKYVAIRANSNEQLSLSDTDLSQLTNDVNDSEKITTPTLNKIVSKWESMKSGLTSLRSQRFIPLSDTQEGTSNIKSHSSSGSLDEIFERLQQPPVEYRDHGESYYNM